MDLSTKKGAHTWECFVVVGSNLPGLVYAPAHYKIFGKDAAEVIKLGAPIFRDAMVVSVGMRAFDGANLRGSFPPEEVFYTSLLSGLVAKYPQCAAEDRAIWFHKYNWSEAFKSGDLKLMSENYDARAWVWVQVRLTN